MSLADDILASVGGPLDQFVKGSISLFARPVRRAQRFYFSSETMAAALQLQQSKPSSLVEALPLARPPFADTWLEWDGGLPGRAALRPGETVPKRFGVLIQTVNAKQRQFAVTFAWSFKIDGFSEKDAAMPGFAEMGAALAGWPIVSLCPMTIRVNWGEEIGNAYWERLTADVRAKYPQYHKQPKEIAALINIESRALYMKSPYSEAHLDTLPPKTVDLLADDAIRDIEGELGLVQCLLVMMNSRNCVSVAPADLNRLNKARARRRKPEFLSYSTVKLELSRRDARMARGGGTSDAAIREHIVRGHFKIRKGGVYWWRPFLRGDATAGLVKRESYEVGGAPQ